MTPTRAAAGCARPPGPLLFGLTPVLKTERPPSPYHPGVSSIEAPAQAHGLFQRPEPLVPGGAAWPPGRTPFLGQIRTSICRGN